jgi:hypothetical protein
LLSVSDKQIELKMMEDGPLLLWCNTKIPSSANFEFIKLSEGLWHGELTKMNDDKVYSVIGL